MSIYGLYLHRLRFGGICDSIFESFLRNETLSTEEIEELQNRLLEDFIRLAYEQTDYYRELFDGLGIEPSGIENQKDLARIPITEKDHIRKNPERFVSKRFKKDRLVRIGTSGTTGKPLTIFCDKDSLRRNYAFVKRVAEWNGVRIRDKRATFAGRVIVPPGQEKPPFWRYDAGENSLLFSSYHLTPTNLPSYYEKLLEFQPKEIRSYPSSLYVVASYMKNHGLKGICPKAITTSAETLLPYQRSVIEKQFDCEIRDQYGGSEMVIFVSQCQKGTYHLHPESGILEIVNSDGEPAPAGEPGEIVCTGFINRAMPLIRYRLGDIGKLAGHSSCPCGRNFPVIEKIEGRIDDYIKTIDGRMVGRLDPVFKGAQGILATQIIQTSPKDILLKVVPDNDYQEKHGLEVIHELHNRVGTQMDISILLVDSIPKDSNGKFRAVISQILRDPGSETWRSKA
jgi:phenylacetate-CoA ligase